MLWPNWCFVWLEFLASPYLPLRVSQGVAYHPNTLLQSVEKVFVSAAWRRKAHVTVERRYCQLHLLVIDDTFETVEDSIYIPTHMKNLEKKITTMQMICM